MTRTPESTGGQLLRMLRKKHSLVQLDVEIEAGLGTGYLQRLELGKVKQPTRAVLERLLRALGASYLERRAVLDNFGYVMSASLPDQYECARAVQEASDTLLEAPFPTYLLDCAYRLLAWSYQVPLLLGLTEQSSCMQQLKDRSLIEIVFDPSWGVFPLVRNPDQFFPLFIQILQREWQPYGDEPWCQHLSADLLARLALFRHYWEQRARQRQAGVVVRPHVPLLIAPPGYPQLQFRITADQLHDDPRFRIVSYIPLDEATLQQCTLWKSSDESISR